VFFFFSSRRRHTRFSRDWSSDVCSSDLRFVSIDGTRVTTFGDVQRLVSGRAGDSITFVMLRDEQEVTLMATPQLVEQEDALGNRSEERRVGKEGRSRRSPEDEKERVREG